MTNLSPFVQEPNKYADGCEIAWASTTTLTISTGQVRDSTNVFDIPVSSALTINGAVNGANGLDTGSLANNTWYAVFVCGDPTNGNLPVGLLSLSATAPGMPQLYGTTFGCFRRVGWVKTNGSAQFVKFIVSGKSRERFYQWDSPLAVLTGGAETTFTAQSLSAGAPPQASPVYLNATYTPTAAASVASIRPTGSSAASLSCPIELKANVDDVAVKLPMLKILPLLSSSNPSIDYLVTSGDALTLAVAAFEDVV